VIPTFVRVLAALAVALAVGVPAAHAEDDPAVWLERMAVALERNDYEGTLVYVHDGEVEAMRVVRTHSEAGPREVLTALTGERREIVREGASARFTLAGGRLVLAGVIPDSGPGESRRPGAAEQYELLVVGTDRVAGHDSAVLDARPRDDSRYGYRLWLEAASGMLLGSRTFGADGEPVEQLMFTELRLTPAATAAAGEAPQALVAATTAEVAWRAEAMPPGFRLIAIPPGDAGTHHLVYSDGLASVSLYIEPQQAGALPPGMTARRGAVGLVGRALDGFRVVVVGDLPAPTLDRIAASVVPVAAH
jgi:sigma-E factor negative regulatory protein RseB